MYMCMKNEHAHSQMLVLLNIKASGASYDPQIITIRGARGAKCCTVFGEPPVTGWFGDDWISFVHWNQFPSKTPPNTGGVAVSRAETCAGCKNKKNHDFDLV